MIDIEAARTYHKERRALELAARKTAHVRWLARTHIDVAIICDPETEPAFWRALERALQRDVDLRPLTSSLARSVELTGELVYER
ncbi:MAG: hypothetical protein JW892_04810 [Anaerolineae bacterium]|nr:hypothetical protein [Anaerolineae bacterium]